VLVVSLVAVTLTHVFVAIAAGRDYGPTTIFCIASLLLAAWHLTQTEGVTASAVAAVVGLMLSVTILNAQRAALPVTVTGDTLAWPPTPYVSRYVVSVTIPGSRAAVSRVQADEVRLNYPGHGSGTLIVQVRNDISASAWSTPVTLRFAPTDIAVPATPSK
jgi:hypothetical protein